ncbi:MAG TPA: carboxypeptidase regulatory-like domain-containing protein [Bryobacteraceae bacterium]|nr:carboxypeptidase regulatory-like domain-containing protein [Bryobacteraceae bacterium]
MKSAFMKTLMNAIGAGAMLLLALTVPAFAQTTSGELTGTVYDATGAVVPDATVTATNQSTGVVSTATTTAGGQYRINNLLVGTYDLAVTAAGFTKSEVKNVAVTLNQLATANITLQVGQAAQTVEVSAEATTIDTTTAQLQQTYTTQQLENLPMASSGSGVINTSLLQAGIGTGGAIGLGTGPSVGGQRPRNNNFTVEGIDNNNKAVTGPLVQVPNDAVSEFTVIANQFSPEYGHSSGGQFNQIIKSGTNEFHGMLYEYFNNRDLNAADNLNAVEGNPLHPRYDNNRFGGNFGGPIKKNKLFFFVDWEYNPVGQSSSTAYDAPTAAGYSLLAAIPGISMTNLQQYQKYLGAAPTQTESALVNPNVYVAGSAAGEAGLAGMPGTVTIPMGTISSSLPNYANYNTGLASIDYSISDTDQLRGRFILERTGSIDTAGFPQQFFTTIPYNYYLVTISEYHNFSPNLTNELRLGFNRYLNDYSVPNISFPGLDQFPNIDVYEGTFGEGFGPDPNAPQYGIQNTYQINDGVNWTKGSHSLHFGFDGYSWISPQSFVQRSRGDYEWDYLSDYMFDYYPDYIAQRSLGGQEYSGNQYLYGFYGNDSWKVKPNLTVNIGLRYEYLTVPIGEQLQTLNQVSSVPGLIEFNKPTPMGLAFMPRIGIAYSPGTSGKTVIRAGFGRNFDVLPDNFGLLTEPPQFTTTVDCTGGPQTGCNQAGGPGAGFLANGGIKPGSTVTVPSLADLRAGTGGYVPDQTRPEAVQWNIGVQHVFANDYTFDSEYIGTHGVYLPVQIQLNRQPVVTPQNALPLFYSMPSQGTLDSLTSTLSGLQAQKAAGGNILPGYLAAGFDGIITSYQPWGNSIYNGWANTLTRRFANGWQLVGAYTWSHNIDDSTAEVFSTYVTPRRPENAQDLALDRSSSALDHRQRFTVETIYDFNPFKNGNWLMKNIVGNWEIAPVYQYQTGTLYDVQSAIDSNLNGDTAGDRAFVNGSGQPGVGSGTTPLTNTAGQTVAYLVNNPNARYITAPEGTFPNGGRNTGMLPPIDDIDLTLAKNLNLTERFRLQFSARFFNLFNHPQYVGGFISDVAPCAESIGGTTCNPTSAAVHNFLIPTSSIFGDPTQAFSSNPRQLQLAMKLIF